MATKNTGTLIAALERRYLECTICTESFDEDKRIPRLLPCHHPFCTECLKRLGRKKDQFKCPTCNSVHKVKKNGPIDFPKDNTRRDLTSFLQAHSDLYALKKCCICGNTADITYKCQYCNINLCEICRCQHETENKTHKLIVNKPTTFREEDDNLDVCQDLHHESAKLKYFCNSSNCQTVLCSSCVIDDHRDISKHDLEDIEEAFEKRKNELGDDVESLRSRISHVESTIQNIVDNTSTFQNERDEFNRKVDDIYNTGIKVLEEKKTIILDKYNISFQMKKLKAVTRKDNLDSFLTSAKECCSLSEQLINRNSKRSFLNVHQTVEAHMKRYLNTPVEKSTCGEKDSEENMIDFDDHLRLFERNVEILENHVGDGFNEPLIEPAKENPQEGRLTNMMNTFRQNFFKMVATRFICLFHKIKKMTLYVYTLFCTITNILLCPQNQNAVHLDVDQPNERHDQQHLDLENTKMKKILYYVLKFRNFTWQCLWLLILVTVIHEIKMIPLILTEYDNLTGLKFETESESPFACRSADNQSVSTKPFENMLCGSRRKLYKYEGVFANTSFVFEKESSIEILIRFQLVQQQNVQKYDKLTAFEFGLSEDSISNELLFPSILSVTAFPCSNTFGVCLLTGNGILLADKDILERKPNSSFVEGQFSINYQPSDSLFSIRAKYPKSNTTTELHGAQVFNFRIPIWAVFAAYISDKFNVSMTLTTHEVGFNRETLHQHLYISNDNKTMSNKKLSDTFLSNRLGTNFIFTRPKKFEKSNIIQTMIYIDFSELKNSETYFKFGIGEHKGDSFIRLPLFECIRCEEKYFFGIFPITGYCLSYDNISRIIVENQFSFFLHYQTNGIVEMIIPDYFWGYIWYSSFRFQLKEFNKMSLSLYIEKLNAKDIFISSSENANISHLEIMFLGIILGMALLSIRNMINR